MSTLELKIPPPIVALTVAGGMWYVASSAAAPSVPASIRIGVAIAIALLGIGVIVAGAIAFRQANTTVNPMKPEKASSLVTSGIFTISRNPMYVGLLLVLAGWAAFLWSAFALVGPLVFFLYISRFQIAPEERVLSRLFGREFDAYRRRVRRWL